MKLKKSPYFLLILATLVWGGNFVVGRAVSTQVPPYTLSFLRMCTSLIVFLPFAWKEIIWERRVLLKNWWVICLMSLTGLATFNTLLYVALHYTTSINASLITATSPIVIALFSFFILGEKLTLRQIMGACTSIIGVLFIISKGSLSAIISFTFTFGDLLVMIAVFLWGFYSLIVRHYARKLPEYSTFALTIAVSVILIFPLFAWDFFYMHKEVVWSLSTVSAILYVGIFASLVGFLSWNSAVAQIGPAKAGIFLNLNPFFASIFAILFIGEKLAWYQVLGGLLVVVGVYVSAKVTSRKSAKHFLVTGD